MARIAWVAGATGLVGGLLLRELLKTPEYERVVALVRRPADVTDPKLTQRVVEFAKLNDESLGEVDDVFCSLGTTIKTAGSQAAFRAVDLEYPLALARVAKAQGAKRYALVSSVGADARSSNFYLRTKGELEERLRDMGFQSLLIFRPSFLIGERQERRSGERMGVVVAKLVAPLMVGGLKKYRPVLASNVAKTMVRAAVESKAGVFEWDAIMHYRSELP